MGAQEPDDIDDQMAGVERMSAEDKTRTIAGARAKAAGMLALRWSDGTRAELDLGAMLRGKAFRTLRDPAEFARVRNRRMGSQHRMAVGRGVGRRNALAGDVVGHGPRRHAEISGMAPAPWSFADEDGRSARRIAADDRLLLERRETGAAAHPAGVQGLGSQPRGVRRKSHRAANGGRDRDRTCDPYDVNVVLSR